ncbi:hydroxyacid dehydrogenase [Kibdelosporangium philippinense]|uniref:Hydroxyacid dehydrogenase n=1 Tax=Kibdelosporangium philippinense TaxID=211113 RepID=A0ABS8ZAN6_9PSEU|nr:hydroxyacid dehydrogenase [Kibdelosporangium philippinense]MCE7004462.1 hydroxyacid dehydrogenase [Kibdelosporangium philippinense]
MTLPRTALAMETDAADAVFTPAALTALGEVCDLAPGLITDFGSAHEVLRDVEVLVTGWGCPPIDEEVLSNSPKLRAIVHAAGSVRGHVTEACWERGILVSSAASANALPVAEYTLAMILLSGKRVLERAHELRTSRTRDYWLATPQSIGNYGRTVGILSASMIGRRVIELLRPFDFKVLLHDPYATDAAELGVTAVSIEELFASSDVVSVHTPLLPETRGLVRRSLIFSMRKDAVLINTARGAVVDQEALLDAEHIRAILDVTDPDVLPPQHPLWQRENIIITPHLAGSQGNEWQRLASLASTEVRRYAAGEPFAFSVLRERFDQLA